MKFFVCFHQHSTNLLHSPVKHKLCKLFSSRILLNIFQFDSLSCFEIFDILIFSFSCVSQRSSHPLASVLYFNQVLTQGANKPSLRWFSGTLHEFSGSCNPSQLLFPILVYTRSLSLLVSPRYENKGSFVHAMGGPFGPPHTLHTEETSTFHSILLVSLGVVTFRVRAHPPWRSRSNL